MAFQTKKDYFGFASTTLQVTDSSDGATASVVEATDEKGSIVAHEVFGYNESPTNSYVLKGQTTLNVQLGKVTEVGDKSYALDSVTITTGAGEAPKVSAKGQQVEDDASAACVYEQSVTIPVTHHAADILSAYTLVGSGNYVQSTSYTFSSSITKATKDGVCLAHDVSEGKIECQVEITQTGTVAPTLEAKEGWVLTSPLASSSSDSAYTTWSATLTKYMERSDAPTA